MELTHRFTVPVPIEEAWAHFNDISSVAECFPGATVTSADDDSFAGSVKVKLGPIALVYNGSGSFTEKDETAYRFVVDAKGKDKRGNGTAGAVVSMAMREAGSSTDVEVVTDLAITGKPAQFGRGVMQDVSDKLLGQFVACLEQRFATAAPADNSLVEEGRQGPSRDPETEQTHRAHPTRRRTRAHPDRPDGSDGGRDPTPGADRRRQGRRPRPRLDRAPGPGQDLLEARGRRAGRDRAGEVIAARWLRKAR